jgi:hypothetical protein
MKKTYAKILFVTLLTGSLRLFSQSGVPDAEAFRPDPEREKMFLPYLAVRHGGLPEIESWKASNRILYYKELWYYTESFRVRRDHLPEGVTMDEAMIDISRFESYRLPDKEAIVELPGYRDVLVLIPASQLKYKPEYVK